MYFFILIHQFWTKHKNEYFYFVLRSSRLCGVECHLQADRCSAYEFVNLTCSIGFPSSLSQVICQVEIRYILYVQPNLCATTTLETPNFWPLLTGGRCSEVDLCYKGFWDFKMVVVAGIFGGGRYIGVFA